MSRWFNIASPCQVDKHYMLSPTSRLPDLSLLIEQESYFFEIINYELRLDEAHPSGENLYLIFSTCLGASIS